MKLLLVLVATLLNLTAFADGGDFEKHKAEALTNIDQRIQKLQETKSCMSAAKDHEGMKACREKMQEFNKAERAEAMQKRSSGIDERIKKLQEEKSKLNEKQNH